MFVCLLVCLFACLLLFCFVLFCLFVCLSSFLVNQSVTQFGLEKNMLPRATRGGTLQPDGFAEVGGQEWAVVSVVSAVLRFLYLRN